MDNNLIDDDLLLDDLLLEPDELEASAPAPARDLEEFQGLPVNLSVEFERTSLPLSGVRSIRKGSVILLERRSGSPLDVRLNDKLLGQCELVQVDGRYGVRLLEMGSGDAPDSEA